jgi:hypothetical protein
MEDYYLVDAKQEYTSYLISTLAPSMYTGFKDIFEQSKKILNGNSVFKNFQILLSNVPNWNDHILNREVQDITKETGCDWLDNLLTAVFVSHSKILTSVKIGNYRPKNKKIDLKIPDTNSFIHQSYIQAAREFYKNPLLFLEDTNMIRPDEILKNQKLAHSIIKESIMTTIRKLLPFRNILNEYLSLENQNNTIFIGNTSMGGSIAQSNIPSITLPPPSEPPKPIESSVVTKPQQSLEKTNIDDDSSIEVTKKIVLPVIKDKPLPLLKMKKSKKSEPKKVPVKNIKDDESLSTISSKEKNIENKEENEVVLYSNSLLKKDDNSVSSISSIDNSIEKEIKVAGKELNLFDIESMHKQEDEFSLSMSLEIPPQNKGKKIESLDSASLHKFVNHIKEEFDNKEEQSINVDELSFLEQKKPKKEESIDLDDMSFLKQKIPIKEEESINLDGLSFIEQKKPFQREESVNLKDLSFMQQKIPIQKEEKQESRIQNIENQLVPFVKKNELEYSIDLEKIKQVLKEDGTIIDQSNIVSNPFPLQNITPVMKEKSIDHSNKQTNMNNNIKKISIKYNAKLPFKTAPRKKPLPKGKTTLVEEAADDDSSEMVFK